MQTLFATFHSLLSLTPTNFVRYLHDKIDWSSRLIAILGARGVGKTTLLLQHIKLYGDIQTSLFVFADDLYFSHHSLRELAERFYRQGGKTLYIDEIHKYEGWATEIKNIYDMLPELKVVYTGSSILDLEKGGADLSRRKLQYHLAGLSFREFINLECGLNLPVYELDDILQGKVEMPANLRPLQLFQQYIKYGYYPFYREQNYQQHLRGAVMQMVEVDIPTFAMMNIASTRKLKKLLYILAQNVPFKPNYSKLERDLEISRNTLPDYLAYLEKAGLISILREKAMGLKLLEKIEKVYLNNPNLAYCLLEETPNIGTLRETVFFAWLREEHFISSSPIADFEVNGKTFEVGGNNKGKRQIADTKEGYIVKDDIEYVYQNIIPLWMFGFLY